MKMLKNKCSFYSRLSLVINVLLLMCMQNANAVAINVYLKADNPALQQNIRDLNHYLEKEHFLQKYQIDPFINHHPLHVTLYLTQYPKSALPELLAKTQHLAKKMAPVTATATQFNATSSHYLMVDVDVTPALQQASDLSVVYLSPLRDRDISIPDWAAAIPCKNAAFARYGSPNVYFEFAPHLSVLAKKFKNQQDGDEFTKELTQLLDNYASSFPISFTMDTLAIGLVNEWGQITEELASYPLGVPSLAPI